MLKKWFALGLVGLAIVARAKPGGLNFASRGRR